ncbi:MAG: DNA cytosine methyltransferase [Candidatus Avoscillospira sp.]
MSLDLTPGAGNLLGESYWEIISLSPGESSTLNTGAWPSGARESSLSQILQDDPPQKYYLTPRACLGILLRAKKRGKKLPQKLNRALEIQAGLASPDRGTEAETPAAFAANQRDEVRDLHDIAAAICAQPSVKQQTFIASFSAGAGKSAGSIGYSEEVAPTLKGSASGNCMPSVMCLTDQGGRRIDLSENVSGTLRAQGHGHTPLVYENHGIDGRYTGPHETAPTMSAQYGTGGNNIPLVEHNHTLFSRQRVDAFKDDAVTCTQSARQSKDATDLIVKKHIRSVFLIRRLTPLECERLQGFPDGWTDIPGASDSARYKALGNSVAIPCVEFVLHGISTALQG